MIKRYKFRCDYLKMDKGVTVILPKNYSDEKKYPVLYMHDAQNLFSFSNGIYGTWDVDQLVKDIIIVGLDNAVDHRTEEYTPFEINPNLFDFYKNREFNYTENHYTSDYADLLVNRVKPFIDKNFNTQADYNHTFLAGSSLGALASLYISCKYPNVFSVVGLFSIASHFIVKESLDYFKMNLGNSIYFLSVGTNEGFNDKNLSNEYVNQFNEIRKILKGNNAHFISKIYNDHVHNEKEWKKQFPDFLNILNIFK